MANLNYNTHTVAASEKSPGYVLIFEKGVPISSFYCWDVTAVSPLTGEKAKAHGTTAISLRRDKSLWLATNASVDAVMAAVGDAIAERRKLEKFRQ